MRERCELQSPSRNHAFSAPRHKHGNSLRSAPKKQKRVSWSFDTLDKQGESDPSRLLKQILGGAYKEAFDEGYNEGYNFARSESTNKQNSPAKNSPRQSQSGYNNNNNNNNGGFYQQKDSPRTPNAGKKNKSAGNSSDFGVDAVLVSPLMSTRKRTNKDSPNPQGSSNKVPSPTKEQEHKTRTAEYLLSQTYGADFAASGMAERMAAKQVEHGGQAGSGFSDADVRVLGLLDAKAKANIKVNRWTDLQRAFYDATGRVVDAGVLEYKIREAEEHE
jgi:hypothetical protein